MIRHLLNELPILDQGTIQVIVVILMCAWLLLLVSLVAGKGAPVKRYAATCALTAVSLLVIVFIARQTRRRAGPYQPAEIVAPAGRPYHSKVGEWTIQRA